MLISLKTLPGLVLICVGTNVADVQKNMIVVIIDSVCNDAGLRQMLRNYSQVQNSQDFLQEIGSVLANDLLVESTPPVFNNSTSDLALRSFQQYKVRSHSPSPGDAGDGQGSEEELGLTCAMAGDAGLDSPGRGANADQEDRASRSPSPKVGFVGPIEK